jgi:oligo-1,6-glucosidase
MQWSAAPYGGFSTGVPWIEVNPNYPKINAEAEMTDETSIWNHYRKLIALRKAHDVIVYGTYQSWLDSHPDVFVYSRTLDGERLVVAANFTARDLTVELPGELRLSGQGLISNYELVDALGESLTLKPYEAFAVLARAV